MHPGGYAARLRGLPARHPEWPFVVLVAVAWLLVVEDAAASTAAGMHQHDGVPGEPVGARTAGWIIMLLAMMLPLMLPAIRHAALNSIPRRRFRAMTLVAVGSLGCWVPLGPLVGELVPAVGRLDLPVDHRPVIWALAVATLWQLTDTKRRALNSCHRTVPLPIEGVAADRGCLRFGWVHGWRCLRSCWALMLVMAVPGPMSPAVLLMLTGIVLIEEWTVVGRRGLPVTAGLLAGSALVIGL